MIKIDKLNFSYKNKVIFDDASFNFKNQLYYITGKNGCGKSTLLKIIHKQVKYEGSIKIDGIELSKIDTKILRQNYIAFMPQKLRGYNNYSLKQLIDTFLKDVDIEKINRYLDNFAFSNFYNTNIQKLSGGERQKALLIFTLLKETPILFLDEYENNLDNITINQLEESLKYEKRCILIISHRKDIKNHNNVEVSDNKLNDSILLETEEYEKKSIGNTQIHFFKIFRLYFFNNIGSRIVFYLLMCMLFAISFFNLSSAYVYYKSEQGSVITNNYSNNAMVVVAPGIDQHVLQYKSDLYNNNSKFYFNEDDFNDLNNSNIVDYVEITNSLFSAVNNSFYKGYELNVSYPVAGGDISLSYETNNFSKRVVDNTEAQPNNILYGHTPNDGDSNEVAIPLSYANYYSEKNKIDINDIIDKEITFPAIKDQKDTEVNLKVVGIYDDTDFLQNIAPDTQLPLYGSFDINNETTKLNYPYYTIKNGSPEEVEDAYKNLLFMNISGSASDYGIKLDYTKFKENNPDGILAFYVEAKTPNDVPKISEEIYKRYPYAGVFSKYNYETGPSKTYYRQLKRVTIKNIVMLTIGFISIALILLFKYFKNQVEYYKLTDFMGVDRKYNFVIETIEFFTMFIIGSLISLGLDFVFRLNLQNDKLFMLVSLLYIVIIYTTLVIIKALIGVKLND